MKVCAMVDKSAGNESVGDMWVETATFDETAPISAVLEWAGLIKEHFTNSRLPDYRVNVKLAIVQEFRDTHHE